MMPRIYDILQTSTLINYETAAKMLCISFKTDLVLCT